MIDITHPNDPSVGGRYIVARVRRDGTDIYLNLQGFHPHFGYRIEKFRPIDERPSSAGMFQEIIRQCTADEPVDA